MGCDLQSKKREELSNPVVLGADTYVGVKVSRIPNSEIAVGYDFEWFVLSVHSIGLGAVWLAAAIDRLSFATLFFKEPFSKARLHNDAGPFREALEMVRLAHQQAANSHGGLSSAAIRHISIKESKEPVEKLVGGYSESGCRNYPIAFCVYGRKNRYG